MSNPPTVEEVARRVRAALDDADLAAMRDLLHPDVQWGPPGDDRSGCHNRDEVLAWFQRARDAGARGEVAELVARGDKLLVGLWVRGTPAAVERGGEADRWQVLTLRAGRIIDIRGFERRADAVAFAGLPQ